jgi:hypothetical protein
MAKKTYLDKNCDLEALVKDIELWFSDQSYQIQSNRTEGTWLVQAQKTETWRKAVGASRAFNILIQGHPKEFSIELGTGEWATNLAAAGVGAVLTGGVSLIGSGIAAGWSKKIEADLWNFLDQKVMFGDKAKSEHEITTLQAQEAAQEKLKQLKDAFDQGFIDEVAYNAKKLEIEAQVNAQKKETELNEKILKLKKALDAGILSQTEFELKKAELTRETSHSETDGKISRLKAALAAGILSQDEFDKKVADIEKEFAMSDKLKQLKNARDAGIITDAEFEKKKVELLS